eukprot:CAMPEP_0177632616 /NCGR_PEP_ID=MMETSP0447-20121125/2397_1 /TAXON_ID=0 /ORGANISM="Stygamoeba regulata, Strain BSH-02190019" /LENGTH=151 /DNA_ID=CAMNT_0019134217 /DNA_START=217 /DNA_END=672 /DNA_ORIENTATION=-
MASAFKRLNKELKDFQTKPEDWCTVRLVDESSMLKWKATIQGPEDTPYEGGNFTVTITIPAEYPFKAPDLQFETKIYHPNIKTSDGQVCQEILRKDWSPQLKIKDVLVTIRHLLREPSVDSPLEPDIAKEYQEKRDNFNKKAKDYVKKYAK